MDDKQIQDIADRVIDALKGLAPVATPEPTGLMLIPVLAPFVALLAALLVTWVGWRNLKHQQKALSVSGANDDRTEWWKRAQWALEAAMTIENTRLAKMGNEMLRLLSTSTMASDADKDLLDSVWNAGTDVATQQSAEAAIREAEAYAQEEDLDDDSGTGENETTKEASDD